METEKVMFVFYTLEIPGRSWNYRFLPEGWKWFGSSETKRVDFSREEQFQGPEKNKKEMFKYLTEIFEKLKNEKVVKHYKLTESYSS